MGLNSSSCLKHRVVLIVEDWFKTLNRAVFYTAAVKGGSVSRLKRSNKFTDSRSKRDTKRNGQGCIL